MRDFIIIILKLKLNIFYSDLSVITNFIFIMLIAQITLSLPRFKDIF